MNVNDKKNVEIATVGDSSMALNKRQECHLPEKNSSVETCDKMPGMKTTFEALNGNEGLEGRKQGENVKKLIAKFNANIIPHKKHYSPSKIASKHSNSPKSPKKSNSSSKKVEACRNLVVSNSLNFLNGKKSLDSQRSLDSSRILSRFKSLSKDKIDKNVVKSKP